MWSNEYMKNIAIIGCSGAIGGAFVKNLSSNLPDATIYAVSSKDNPASYTNVFPVCIDYQDENSISQASKTCHASGALDLCVVATGILHTNAIMPEKSLKDISLDKLMQVYLANAAIPMLLAKYFVPLLNVDEVSKFAALSARVGSISDNRLGGWYSYRASKSALNMLIKNLSIEVARKNKNALIVGLHPGTVDSNLSKPFQENVPPGKLFSPEYCVENLLYVLNNLNVSDSGKCFAWDGSEVLP